MADLTNAINRVGLARDRAQLLLAPLVLLLLAAGAAAAGFVLGGPSLIAGGAVGIVAVLLALYLAALTGSYRLQVEPGGLRLRWLGGERRYRLERGQITRVVVSGGAAAALRPRFGMLGWAVGPALLRNEETIELVRLSRRPALILVHTDRGRLAIAAADESELLAGLTHAVRLQERLDEIASRRAPAASAPATSGAPAASAAPAPPAAPRVLTGIERTLIEQRLAAERAARIAAAAAGEAAEPLPAPPLATAVVPAVPQPAPLPAAPVPSPDVATVRAAVAVPRPRRRERTRWTRPGWLALPGGPAVAAAVPIVLPVLGAGAAAIAVRLMEPTVLSITDLRLLLVGLALAGPLAALGGLMARAWYPRLGSLVTTSALATLVLLARTILA